MAGVHAGGGLGRGLHGAGACGTRTSRLRGEHPQRAVIAENRIGVDNGVGQFVLVIAITPPDDHTVDCGVIILVDQLLTGQFLDLGAIESSIIVPQPFLYQVAGVETEFFSVIRMPF